MAIVAGTTWTGAIASSLSYNANVREDLEDVIWLLDPMDTWALSNLDRVEATAPTHEWLADNLASAASNIVREGDDAAFSTAVPASRLSNQCQILNKTFVVSDTLEQVKKAGRSSENGRLGTKLLKELKRDMELAIVGNQASSAGGSATGRSMAGMESWIAGPTSTSNGANNAVAATVGNSDTTPGFSAGFVAAPTEGSTTGVFTELTLRAALEGSWTDGGNPRVILAPSAQKKAIDGFAGIATRFVDNQPKAQASIIGAANVYVSSFGDPHMVVLSRYVRSRTVLCLDPDYWALAFLRNPQKKALAKTGDASKSLIVTEFTLVCRNPAASSKVVGCL
jgi:uncharacterized protein DUF5309